MSGRHAGGSPARGLGPTTWYAVLAAALLVAVLLAVVRHAGDPPADSPGPVTTGGASSSVALPDLAPPDGTLPAGVVRQGRPSADVTDSPVSGARACEPATFDSRPELAARWQFAAPGSGRVAEAQLTVTRWAGFGSDRQLWLLGQGPGVCRWLFAQERLVWAGHEASSSWLSAGSDPHGVQVVSAVRAVGSFLVAGVGVSVDRAVATDLATTLADQAVRRLPVGG